MISSAAKQQTIAEYGKSETNTGATEAQVALITARINDLSEHFKVHTKDHHSRRGLLKLVSRRRRLLSYLRRTQPDSYKALIQSLGLRR